MRINARTISRYINLGIDKFEHIRRDRMKVLYQTVGARYMRRRIPDSDEKRFSPINLLSRGVYEAQANLCMNNPQVDIACDVVEFQEMAQGFTLAGNRLIKKINLKLTLQLTIMDALMMGCGIVKTGIGSTNEWLEGENEDINVGQPYALRIDPDDQILDCMARAWDEQAILGHKIRVPEDELYKLGLPWSRIDELPDSYANNYRDSPETAEGLIGERSGQMMSHEVQRYIDLAEVYLPREKIVITLPYKKNAIQTEFLHVAEYDGPEHGGYHKLGFRPVPQNVTDVAPATLWMDTHLLANRIGRKISRQAERGKKVLAYTDVAAEDADNIANADDGTTVRVQNLEELKEIELGGTGDASYKWFAFISDQFDAQTGGDGLPSQPQSGGDQPTARAFAGTQANKAVVLGFLKEKHDSFVEEVCSDLVQYLYQDPLLAQASIQEHTIIDERGVPRRVVEQVMFDPGDERGEWFHYHVSVRPYSMARSDPQTDVRNIMEVFTNVVPALGNAAQAMGPGLDIGKALEVVCRKLGVTDAPLFFKQQAFEQYQAWLMKQKTGTPSDNALGEITIPEPPTPESLGLPTAGNPGQPNPSAMSPKRGKSPQAANRSMAQPRPMAAATMPVKGIATNLMNAGSR